MSALAIPASKRSSVEGLVHDGVSILRDWRAVRAALEGDDEIACDLETGGLRPWRDKVAVVSIYGANTGCLGVLHVRGKIPEPIGELLSDPKRRITYHNGTGFDIPFLLSNGVKATRPRIYDTMVGAGLVITSNRRGQRVSLQAEVNRRLSTYISKKTDHSSWMNPVLTDEQVYYCAEDMLHLHALRREQHIKAVETRQLAALELEMDIAPVVARMTHNGLPMSLLELNRYRLKLMESAIQCELGLRDRFGRNFNVSSAPQVKNVMGQLGVRVPMKLNTKGDMRPSTEATVLQALVEKGPFALIEDGYLIPREDEAETTAFERATDSLAVINSVLRLREDKKRIDMYDEDWQREFWHAGRVRSRFWQTGTDTLRFSSSEPNLQQIPKNMRHVFGHLRGWKIVASDYQQIEVVIAAWVAQDHDLLELIAAGGDIHRMVASQCLNKAESSITDDERRVFKAANFCLIFGGGAKTFQAYALRYKALLTLDQSKEIVRLYFKRFRGLAKERERAYSIADNGREVVTITLANGGVRHILGQPDPITGRLKVKPTQMLNTQVQGNAASGMKFALLECRKAGLDSRLGATVHDELIGAVEEKWAEEFGRELQACMIRGMQRVVGCPVSTDLKIGDHWA